MTVKIVKTDVVPIYRFKEEGYFRHIIRDKATFDELSNRRDINPEQIVNEDADKFFFYAPNKRIYVFYKNPKPEGVN